MSSIISFLVLMTFIACCTASTLRGKEHHRSKRSMLGFHTGITCYHPDVNVIGSYGRYGCFCGLGGSGKPVDETDTCCFHHDECYTHAEQFKPKETSWSMWGMVRSMVDSLCGKSLCSSYKNECVNGTVVCHTKDSSKYEQLLCECDRNASICFARQWHTFRPHLRNISRKLYCDGPNASHVGLDLSLPNQTVQKRIYIDDHGFLIPDLDLLQKEEEKLKNNTTSSEFDVIKEVNPTKKIPTINEKDNKIENEEGLIKEVNPTKKIPTINEKDNKIENEEDLDIDDFDVLDSTGGQSIFTPTRIILCVCCAFVLYLFCFWKLSKKRIQNLGRKTKLETVELKS